MRTSVVKLALFCLCAIACLHPIPAAAAERLCDPGHEDCRAPLLTLIENETVGIDVGFWFMEDARYASKLIERWNAGVPVRVVMDSEAFTSYGYDTARIPVQMMKDAGIPMRDKTGSAGIFHFKTMIFAGQGVVEFSGANYSDEAFVPRQPYVDYVDEVIMFSDVPSIVNSFKTRFDDIWTSTPPNTGSEAISNYANITGPLVRNYPTSPIDPELNFSPWNSFASRSLPLYRSETQGIDTIMYRVTDQRHTNEMIAAVARGVPVRFIGDPAEYRNPLKLWVSWNIDRMYMGGVQVRFRAHAGLSHEKLTLLQSKGMTILGSSNWTSASDQSQHEHNIFSTKTWMYDWGRDHFDRKWNNLGPSPESEAFVPLPPDVAEVRNPVNGAQDQPVSVTLQWYGGLWAHRYDVYFGTDPNALTKIVNDENLGPSESTSQRQSKVVSNLAPGTIYYWKVVSRTMANVERTSAVWSFRTAGGSAPQAGPNDVVLWAMRATTHPGWTVTADTSAAGGQRLANANAGAPKPSAPLAMPTQYFDLSFMADAGVAYRLWIRGKAASNSYENDSVYVQFSDSVTSGGAAQWRTGTSGGTTVTIEDCSNCGLAGWGWNDNAYGAGALGPLVYFAASGTHTIRVQVREDGLSIDQIILSRDTFLNSAPGLTKNDGTIYGEQGGTAGGPPPPPPPSSLPSGWSFADIGAVGTAGSASESNGTFSVTGSGGDVWGTADALGYASTTLTGNGVITARVASVQNVNAWTKVGVMMRDGTAADDAQGFMLVTPTTAKGTSFQRRRSGGAASVSTSGPVVAPPYWVRLARTGGITASTSPDGTTWTVVDVDTFTMGSTIRVGLGVSSHVAGTAATATFDHVTVSSTGSVDTQTLPAGWSFTDIGAVGAAGSAGESNGTFTVSGSGGDVWGTADALGFASTSMTGDGTIVARVATVQNVNAWTKVGVMMREGTTADAAHGFMLVTPTAVKGLSFQRRPVGGSASVSTNGPAAPPPYWVRLTRAGSVITADVSTDGTAWTTVASDTFTMGSTIRVGLAVSSHVAGTTATATFDHVTITN